MSIAPVYHFMLEDPSPSNNSIREMHPHAYKHMRRAWRMRMLVALAGAPRNPVDKALLQVCRHSAGQLDWDNAYGGLKPLLDCLVVASPRNPDGLGLITDDSPAHMPFPPIIRQMPAKRGAGQTIISVFAYSPAAVHALIAAYTEEINRAQA